MIGGKIISYESLGEQVTFFVIEKESLQTCYVIASMNKYAQRLIDKSAAIWWDSKNVYIQLGDVMDCKFNKIGYSFSKKSNSSKV